MFSTNSHANNKQPIKGLSLPLGQLLALMILLVICVPLILLTISEDKFSTINFLIFTSVAGLFLCRNTKNNLNAPSLKILGYLWLVKLGVTFLLLYLGWMPELDPSSANWGFDPQRYYLHAKQLLDNNWTPDFVSLTYVGILYYYAAIFYLIGHNPIVPALFNCLVTLVATLYLIKVGYEIRGRVDSRNWTLSYALLIPEVLWYDVMTSRETLIAALLLISTLTVGRYLARISSISLFKVITIVLISVLFIGAVRTSMVLSMSGAIVMMMMLIKPQSGKGGGLRVYIIIGVLITLLIFGATFAGFNIAANLNIAFSAKDNIALSDEFASQWSDNSIGQLLLPNGLIESILFLPPRMLLYLVAPLPKILTPIQDLIAGNREAWQQLMTFPSSVLNILIFPYVLASLAQSWKDRHISQAPLIFHIPYWLIFISIAGGNLIIHERYRVMATLLLYGCAWLGLVSCQKTLIRKMSVFWYGLLFASAFLYAGYKFI